MHIARAVALFLTLAVLAGCSWHVERGGTKDPHADLMRDTPVMPYTMPTR
jgi:hypothetical protein